MDLKGVITKVFDQKSGDNDKGHWTLQGLVVKGFSDNKDYEVKVWQRPDLKSAKGKNVSLKDLEVGDYKGKPQYILQDGRGSIEVDKDTAQKAPSEQGKSGQRTINDYESTLSRAIRFVHRNFSEISGGQVNQEAVSQVVTSYMAAYSRGDFVVPQVKSRAPAPTPAPSDEDIPF